MPNTFLISDTHFGHNNMCVFKGKDGTANLRPWANAQEMDEAMIENWNSVVKPNDKVYHLGDVVIARRHLQTLSRLNGDKILIKGNHDIFKLPEYTQYFRDVRACHVMDMCVLTHIPIHKLCLARFKVNIHGHTHDRNVLLENGEQDPFYMCVCVEQIHYTPISFDVVRQKIKDQTV